MSLNTLICYRSPVLMGGGNTYSLDIKEGGAGVHIVTDIKVKGRNNLRV